MQAMCHLEVGDVRRAVQKMREVPKLCFRKVAGKLIPPEQYALKRATDMLAVVGADGDDYDVDAARCALMLPGFEHTLLNRGFHQMPQDVLKTCLTTTDRVLANLCRGIDDAGVSMAASAADAGASALPAVGAGSGAGAASGSGAGAGSGAQAASPDGVAAQPPQPPPARVTAATLDAAVKGCKGIRRWESVAVDRVALCALCRGTVLSQLHGDANPAAAAQMFQWVIDHRRELSTKETYV